MHKQTIRKDHNDARTSSEKKIDFLRSARTYRTGNGGRNTVVKVLAIQ